MENRGFEYNEDCTCQLSNAKENQNADRPWLGGRGEVFSEDVSNFNGKGKRWSLPDTGHHHKLSFSHSKPMAKTGVKGKSDEIGVPMGDTTQTEHALTRVDISTDPDLATKLCNGESLRYMGKSSNYQRGNSSSVKESQSLVCLTRLHRMSQSLSNLLVFYCLIVFGTWALIYILFGETEAFPGGGLFGLLVLEVFSIFLGRIAELVHLPPAIGMVAAGIILRNIDGINVVTDIYPGLSGNLRAISIVILLSRGALGVNGPVIRKYWKVIPGLSVLSCIFEALVGGTVVYFIVQFPAEWSALMGCILSAMSGAIVLPYLIEIDSKCCGAEEKKVLVIAKVGCGLDAILAICMAEFALGFIFSDGDIAGGLTKGVAEVVMGGTFGVIWGIVVGYLFDHRQSARIQTFALFTGGVMGLLGLTKIGYPRGGPLGTFAGVLVAVSLWKNRKAGDSSEKNVIIQENFTFLWFLFQPLLFGIIGSRTDLSTVQWEIVLRGMICLVISMSARTVAVLALTTCDDLTWSQRLFLAVSWLPKGTVQAALGPVALDTAIALGSGDGTKALGYQIMNIAVATILLASFFGSTCLLLLGKRIISR